MKLERLKLENSSRSSSFQLCSVLCNFGRFFPTSLDSFQHKQKLSNFKLQTFQIKTFQLLVLFNCHFQLHVSLLDRVTPTLTPNWIDQALPNSFIRQKTFHILKKIDKSWHFQKQVLTIWLCMQQISIHIVWKTRIIRMIRNEGSEQRNPVFEVNQYFKINKVPRKQI